jgi:integrase
MKTSTPRKPSNNSNWPRKVTFGRESVTVYRREIPSGGFGFMVANYSAGKRRFDSYPTEAEALDAAQRLARQLSERQVVAASMTNGQAAEYAAAVLTLKPHGVTLTSAADTLAKCLETVHDLSNLLAAAKFYAARQKSVTRRPVSEVVAELLAVKAARKASTRYLQDLRVRLARFADAFRKDCCDVTTAEVQAWLDSLQLSRQSYKNFRTVAHLFFEFAVARGYAADNPVTGSESLTVGGGDVEIFTPAEIRRLLAAATPDFLPCLALGAFAGLRSAEIERLAWEDIRLAERHIVIGASKAKTASRRVVPISDTLAAWLAPYAAQTGAVWQGTHEAFYIAQQATAAATAVPADAQSGTPAKPAVKWKQNALRHSYASYRFAQTTNAGRVAGELGNSAAVVHRHYRELVKPADAERWFAVKPAGEAANVVTLPREAVAA